MWMLRKLFGIGMDEEEVTSLKLEMPAGSGPAAGSEVPNNPALSAAQEALRKRQEMQTAYDKSPLAAENNRRVQELIDSRKTPEFLYYVVNPENKAPFGFVDAGRTDGALLLFSSAALAHQWLRSKKVPLPVMQTPFVELDALVRVAKAAGMGRYIFDLTPKRTGLNMVELAEGSRGRELVLRSWAASRVMRSLLAQSWFAEFQTKMGTADMPERLKAQRSKLEQLRDFGAGDVPFVHWLIALIAGMQKDEEVRLAAIQTLEEFGPAFKGIATFAEDKKDMAAWAKSFSTAQVGLMTEFGLLKGPDGAVVPSILRSVDTPVEG